MLDTFRPSVANATRRAVCAITVNIRRERRSSGSVYGATRALLLCRSAGRLDNWPGHCHDALVACRPLTERSRGSTTGHVPGNSSVSG